MAPAVTARVADFAAGRISFAQKQKEQGIELPEKFGWAAHFSRHLRRRRRAPRIERAAESERLRIAGWRRVPVECAFTGAGARSRPCGIWQFFVDARRRRNAGAL